ncbi:winged helix-turn-helix transcriptional regulator [Pedococcus sp. 5OH_020]|uniref:winged helix-turn-helix transcriptional regulator n=1 Tax=Pedococcus sp. 5OH_020 TaxID=2989814 RepID=UPI0022E9F8B9|nr:helix-turn-helix domain-containing protein [Pedococcus sp. 5OH_020]
MEWKDYDSATCSIARTLEVVGDRWTVLVLRDLANGVRRFDDLASHLGVARDVLTRRLNVLVDHDVVEKVPYREQGSRTRYEYRLTAAGQDLRSVLLAFREWGDQHLSGPEGPPMATVHADCGGKVHAQLVCERGHTVERGETRLVPQPGARLSA